MKKYINIMLALVLGAGLFSCSKDTPFDNEFSGATGKLLKSSLSVSLDGTRGPRSLRDRNVRMALPAADDFGVDFIKEGQSEPTLSFPKYSEMPEIVTLPVGNYTAVAHYGENPSAEWEAPYYAGTSEKFVIAVDEITDEISPIKCKLANVRVSIKFDEALQAAMDPDCKVSVHVGESGILDFSLQTLDKSGYFAYVEDSHTLAAVFNGNVDGYPTTETKTYTDVQPGNHYSITFRLHDAGEEDPGNISGKDDGDIIIVDALVSTEDMNQDIDPGETTLPDTMRPQEGDDPGSNPGQPDNPGKDDPADGNAPTVEGEAPIVLDQINVLPTDGSPFPVAIRIHSDSDKGIQTFKVSVKMANVSDQELYDLGLAPEMDLVNTDPAYAESLKGLGFPVNIGGQKDVRFEITELMDMLGILKGLHEFKLTVGDEYGTTVRSLLIQCN